MGNSGPGDEVSDADALPLSHLPERLLRDLSPVYFNTASRKATITIPGLSPAQIAFGDAICATRKEQGISQEAFALKCGLVLASAAPGSRL